MKIYIPTYQRIDKQKTWDTLPPAIRRDTVLVVNKAEAKGHEKLGRPVLVSPRQGLGMAAIRGWIQDYVFKSGLEKFAILDDDLQLQRRDPATMKICNATPGQFVAAFRWMEDRLSEFTCAAFGTRSLAYADPASEIVGGRAMQALGFNTEMLRQSKCRFDKSVPDWFPMDDFHMTLQLLKAGHPNCISLVWRMNPGASNSPGGCFDQRKGDRQSHAARLLYKLHAPFVKLREKKAWRGISAATMTDVTVFWKQAAKHGAPQCM